MMVAIGIIAVLISLLLGVISSMRNYSNTTTCLNNLHTIQNGFNQYALENGRFYPDPNATAPHVNYEKILTDGQYVSNDQVFRCPADRFFDLVGSSYDWRDVPGDQTVTMAGRSLSDASRTPYVLAFESLPGNHSKRKVNAVMSDGSFSPMDQETCFGDLLQPVRDAPITLPTAGP